MAGRVVRSGWVSAVCLGFALLCPGATAPLQAQSVRGRLVDDATGEALPGAWVALVGEDGTPAATALSGAEGGFSLRAPGSGSWSLHAEAPGYSVSPTAVTPAAADGGSPVELRARHAPPPLPDEKLDVDKRCRLDPEDAALVAGLWGEVRKVFRSALVAGEQGLVRYETETWYRQLTPRMKVMEEDHTPHAGFHPRPRLPSPPPQDLAREGYVRGGEPGQALSFFGPDAGTLVSPSFTANHCLGFDDDGPEDGWVGLTFRPLDERAKDVEGTLWIDGATFEPKRLEYRYTALPWPVKSDRTGGMMEFTRAPGGAPIAVRWWQRMPRVQMKNVRITQWAEPRPRYTLAAIIEEGGEVLRIQTADGHVQEMR